jgi:hypothetical protein
MAEALKMLASAIARERTTSCAGLSDEERAVREALLGFGILAFNEGRAFLIVAGAGLDRHARVHFRSLMEYEFRVKRILEDPTRATAFFDAFVHEFRKVTSDLEVADQEAVEAEIERVLGRPSAEINTGSEKKALFGKSASVKSAMEELPEGARRYAGTFGLQSQVSHGSVLALREVARSTEGVGGEFLDVASRDGYGNRLAYTLIWVLLHLANCITKRFEDGVLRVIDAIIQQTLAINDRLQFVTPEQEKRAAEVLRRSAKRINEGRQPK